MIERCKEIDNKRTAKRAERRKKHYRPEVECENGYEVEREGDQIILKNWLPTTSSVRKTE